MYKLLIVDDEPLVRHGIAGIIDWHKLGIDTVLEAEDGELGLEAALLHHPDIVLTDIAMPFMDGLTMAKNISSQLPDTKIVILTCHDEFEYATKSIQLGITDYILKPISSDNLIVIMNKIITGLNEDQSYKHQQQKFRDQLRQSLPVLREKLLIQLVTGQIPPMQVMDKLKALDVKLDFPCFTICVFELTDYANEEDMELYNLLLQEQLNQQFAGEGLAFCNYNNHHILLVKTAPSHQNRYHLSKECEKLITGFHGKTGCSINAAISATSIECDHIPKLYDSAVHTLSCNANLGNNVVMDFMDLGQKSKVFSFPSALITDVVKACFSGIDFDQALKILIDELSSKESLTISNLQLIAFSLVTEVHKAFIEFEGDLDYEIVSKLLSIKTLPVFYDVIYSYLKEINQKCSQNRQSRKQVLVRNVKDYIAKHYADPNLNLNTIASSAYISPSYLSTLFKKETGLSLVDYLTSVRIDQAKLLLKQEKLKAYEVAQAIGYQDSHYFSICFKKYTSLSPSEYKKQSRQQ